ncbi:MAG: hypothetical protein LBF89_06105 [Bacteroidales bacterium]|jgi:hypothetical protein|nr:hypothetical protein [Bacteroidales bacterium]
MMSYRRNFYRHPAVPQAGATLCPALNEAGTQFVSHPHSDRSGTFNKNPNQRTNGGKNSISYQ